jgi:DNA-binding NtrC family response regulator
VPAIAETIARQISPELRLSAEAMTALRAYSWPGNARELRNVLTRAFVMHGTRIEASDLAFTPLEAEGSAGVIGGLRAPLEDHEREIVLDALRRARQNRTETARLLGIPRSTLIYKLRRWGIS